MKECERTHNESANEFIKENTNKNGDLVFLFFKEFFAYYPRRLFVYRKVKKKTKPLDFNVELQI